MDVTTESLVPKEAWAEAHLVAREPCVISGVEVAKEVFDAKTWERICERSSSLKLQVRPKLPVELSNVALRP